MGAGTFLRREQKYLLTADQRSAVEAALRQRLAPDPHGESLVCSVYYDTPDYRLIRKSVEKPVYKEKLRLRCYGEAAPETAVFVEMKRKYDGVVYKRRVEAPEKSAVEFLNGGPPPEESQIARELTRFRDFYGSLRPAIYLNYRRSAWLDPGGSDLRVTLDREIRWRTERLRLAQGTDGTLLIPQELTLMEIKAADAMPLWLAKLLSAEQIRQTSFSKVGRAYQELTHTAYHKKGDVSHV